MSRIWVINPNTTRAMTSTIEACARAVAGPDTEIVGVTSEFGPPSIESHYDEAMSVPGLLDAVKRGEAHGVDGYVIACFGDPGLDAAREVARGPVIGIAEAAMHTASHLGRGFSVVAHEVKQLATRTSQATDDVRGGLQGIIAASLLIEDRVAKLAESIDQVAGVAETIAESMRKQDANSQAITSTTARTASDVREVAAGVSDVAGMIGETRQAADLVTKVSTDLGQQAADLRAAVERFVETTERIAA